MEVDGQVDVKSELPTPPASDVGSPTSFSHCVSDSEPDSPMVEDNKVRNVSLLYTNSLFTAMNGLGLKLPCWGFVVILLFLTLFETDSLSEQRGTVMCTCKC